MTRQDQATQEQFRPETSRGHYLLEVLGVLWFVLLLLSIGVDVYQGMVDFDDLWIAPILAVLAYLAADFLSGFVHFLANNSGPHPLLQVGGASDLALPPWYRPQAQVRVGRNLESLRAQRVAEGRFLRNPRWSGLHHFRNEAEVLMARRA
jgi:hypothetical protein